MQRFLMMTLMLGSALGLARPLAAADPNDTVVQAELVLGDQMAIPIRQIPQHLLNEAQAVAIIPNVIKIGFVAGARRGHGVVLTRDAQGEWSLPQFVTLTGGSVGWQAGIQGTDVVLVFTSHKGVEGLMRGKFTIGLDASVSAGPVGRDAEAATDPRFKTEVFSYSRSQGLFLGVAVDGSALEIDHHAHAQFYGSPTNELPRRMPESAVQLRNYLTELTPGSTAVVPPGEPVPLQPAPRKLDILKRSLVHHAGQLHALVGPEWRQYLALPKEILDPVGHPSVEALTAVEQRYARVATTAHYRQLAGRPEFQTTHQLLVEYLAALSAEGPALHLPPPPTR
jgi:lipid-binding SYLF domain-containing protein